MAEADKLPATCNARIIAETAMHLSTLSREISAILLHYRDYRGHIQHVLAEVVEQRLFSEL